MFRFLKLFILCSLTALLPFVGTFHSNQAQAFCDLEFAEIKVLSGARSVDDLEEAKLGTFNVLNLEFSPGRYVTDPKTGVREFQPGLIDKDKDQIKGVAQAIKEEDLDFVVLQEVEGRAPLERFNERFLDDRYEVFHLKGNDSRGIDIGFLVKKDLPLKIRMHGQTHRTWQNPATGKTEAIFSRDLPALHIRHKSTSMNDPPEMIFAGTHYKSQRSRSGDPRSENMRARQVEETVAALKEYEEAYPGVPIFLGGDFNADIHSKPEFKALFEKRFMQDSFDLSKTPLKRQDRITHTYHPRQGPTENNQLDAILTNETASETVLESKVYRYKDPQGRAKPLPKTYEERELNPSDHFMVVVRARLSKLFEK